MNDGFVGLLLNSELNLQVYYIFQIDKRRKGLFPVQPKPPQGFKDYLMNRCTYVLAGNASSRLPVSQVAPPAALQGPIKDLFVDQEKERFRLRTQVSRKINSTMT